MEEQVVIESPENVEYTVEIAGLGRRFAASIIDSALQSAVQFLLLIVTLRLLGIMVSTPEMGQAVVIGIVAEQFFVFIGYYVVCEMLMAGQSPGKRLCGIRVVRLNGQPISFSESFLRNVVRFFDFLPVFYAIGIVCVFISRQSRRLGDLAAGTLVVRDAPRELPTYLFVDLDRAGLPAGEVALIRAGVARLSREEYDYVCHLLERLPGLDPRAAQNLVQQSGQRLMAQFGILASQPDYAHCYNLLRAVAAAYAQRSVAG